MKPTKAEIEEATKRTIKYVLYSKDSPYIKRLKMLNLETLRNQTNRKARKASSWKQ